MKRLRRLFLLPGSEKLFLAKTLMLVLTIRLGLWLLPFRLIDKWFGGLESPNGHAAAGAPDWAAIRRIVRAVRSASSYIPQASCLTQALAARYLLRSAGERSDLKIGVEKTSDAGFGAHSWVEIDGRVVIGRLPDHQRFAVLESLGNLR